MLKSFGLTSPLAVILFASAAGAVILGCCSAWLATFGSGLPMEWPQ